MLAYPSAAGLVRNTQALGSFDRPDGGGILLRREWPSCGTEIENIILDSISRTYIQHANMSKFARHAHANATGLSAWLPTCQTFLQQ